MSAKRRPFCRACQSRANLDEEATEEWGEAFLRGQGPVDFGSDDGAIERGVLGPAGSFRDFGQGGGEDFFGGFDIGPEVGGDGVGGDGEFVSFPAIVVGDHGEGGAGDFGFAGEFGFGEIGHADDVAAELAIGFGFGAGGKGGAVHIDVGAVIVEGASELGAGLAEEVAEIGRVGIAEANVGDDAIAEEGVVFAAAGAVKELIGDDDVKGMDFFAEAADGGDANEPADVERAEGVEIGPVIDFMWGDAVAATVSGKKIDGASGVLAFDDVVGWSAERSGEGDFFDAGESFQFVEATASNDADGGCG